MEATKEALTKAQDYKSKTNKAGKATKVTNNTMKAGFQKDLKKAKQAQEDTKGSMIAAATQMFMFYLNLLSPKSKYSWNQITSKQNESDLFVNQLGVSLESLRGFFCKWFNNCIMFHLLTAFPINTAEQEMYCISNALKKSQPVNICQFVRPVGQLNAYIIQMPCFYYNLNVNVSSKPENVPFRENELGAHLLCVCPIQWQDQYNMNKKGMMPMDMHLLLTSLEAIKRICTYEKGRIFREVLKKNKKWKKCASTDSIARVSKKVHFEKNCNLCKKHGGMYTMHNTRDCRRFEKDQKETSDFRAAKKGRKKGNPVNQNFAQLTKKSRSLRRC